MITHEPRRGATAGCALSLLAVGLLVSACSSGARSPAAGTASSPVPSSAGSASSVASGSGSTSTARATAPTCGRPAAPGASGGGADVLVPGDIPDNQAYVVFRSPTGDYHLSVPEGWARTQAGQTVSFTDKFNSIQVQVAAAPSPPSVASAQSGEVAALAASAPCFQAGKVSQVARSAGPAVLITYRADSPPDPVTGKTVLQDVERYEFWRAGTQATITLSSPQGSDNVDPWRKVTDSFAWG